MKTLMLLVTSLVFSASAMASSSGMTNGIDSKWVKIFSLSLEKPSDQVFTNYLPTSSTKVEIFASANMKEKTVYAIKSHISHDSNSTALVEEPVELDMTRFKYLSLLDLATRQQDSWGSNVVYEIKEDCNAPRLVKHLYFNGQTQTILSGCGETTQLPMLSKGMGVLVKRLEAFMMYENL